MPKAPSLLIHEKEADILKNLDQYIKRYEAEEQEEEEKDTAEVVCVDGEVEVAQR